MLGQPRSTNRYKKKHKKEKDQLVERIIFLASEYGRYGCRRLYNLFISRGIPEHIRSDNVLNLKSSFLFGYT